MQCGKENVKTFSAYKLLHNYCEVLLKFYLNDVTGNIKAHQVLLNRVPEQATEDSVRYKIYY